MSSKRTLIAAFIATAGLVLLISVAAASSSLTPKEQLGKSIFFDTNLSLNANQSCASCHGPAAGWTGTLSSTNAHVAVYEGSIPGAFGDRKPPSAAYATFSPILHMDKNGSFVGGNFWDGRATGERLGNPAAEQAQGPFLNPKEQALFSAADLVTKVCAAAYGDLFRQVWGSEACSDVQQGYDAIGFSVAAYEGSLEVNAFSSKFDYSLQGKAKLTAQERKGYALFVGKAGCKACHLSQGSRALFTDFTFDNLGIPKNPENPVYDYNASFVDPGLGGFLAARPEYAAFADSNMGMHKVPTCAMWT
jgi:cytochrome c peroxidase